MRKRRQRSRQGFSIVETLVALVIGALICFSMLSILSETLRQSSTSQNELYANKITQLLLEHLEQFDYNMLEPYIGFSYKLLENGVPQPDGGPLAITEPVTLDTVNFSWPNLPGWPDPSKLNNFKGHVQYGVYLGPVPDSLRVSVAVSWLDSQNRGDSGRPKTIVTSTVVMPKGTNYWK